MEEASSSSIDSILEFLRKNRFMRAEAALISELSNNSSSSNGVKSKVFDKKQGRDKNQVSDELVVKEIQCGSATESHHQQMNDVSVQTQSPSGANNSSLWEDRRRRSCIRFADKAKDFEVCSAFHWIWFRLTSLCFKFSPFDDF
ncbi:hypothetical protein F2Q70_00023209 [Brassica cretica]|uniref:Uncharacterized protein n=1 Tax=Brassica cretica TaxID=69181 RepID=A0A8S9GIJ4_BRACR|nr:hypothetical protein F2Q70_00023209 [Brassica cretica]